MEKLNLMFKLEKVSLAQCCFLLRQRHQPSYLVFRGSITSTFRLSACYLICLRLNAAVTSCAPRLTTGGWSTLPSGLPTHYMIRHCSDALPGTLVLHSKINSIFRWRVTGMFLKHSAKMCIIMKAVPIHYFIYRQISIPNHYGSHMHSKLN